jgi:hypothetical protein
LPAVAAFLAFAFRFFSFSFCLFRCARVYCPRCKSKEVDKSNTAARYGICSRNSRVFSGRDRQIQVCTGPQSVWASALLL